MKNYSFERRASDCGLSPEQVKATKNILQDIPEELRKHILPHKNAMAAVQYHCLSCGERFGQDKMLYTCPECGGVFLIQDVNATYQLELSGSDWQRVFRLRKLLPLPFLQGIHRFYELFARATNPRDIVYLGEGNTPMICANEVLSKEVGVPFYFKNDGQNPSGSFKDRGMASALSYANCFARKGGLTELLAVCASTGDTSAAAAMYSAYLKPLIKSAVLLPHGKVTPQQLAQPLGSGARVFELPGVFDDCMPIVEALAERYDIMLLNSKNPWRILGQESYVYEIAEEFNYDLRGVVVVVPVGNAGNITAVLSGLLNMHRLGIINHLPTVLAVQSEHADPVVRYYEQPYEKRKFEKVTVRPSVAQAAMIGNPVSMPRVIVLVSEYNSCQPGDNVKFINVSEQDIMDWQIKANRNGHISCTHGGECLAGLVKAVNKKLVPKTAVAVVDSTAHALKFSGFSDMYFQDKIPKEYNIEPDPSLVNLPEYVWDRIFFSHDKHPRGYETGKALSIVLNKEELKAYVGFQVRNLAIKMSLQEK